MTALILDAIPGPVWAALGGLVAIFVAWVTGRRSGTQAAKTRAAEKAADNLATARDARDEVDSISGGDVSKRLSKWRRK
jgi:hypothetical protein